MSDNDEFSYTFKGLPDKSAMQYILMFYAGALLSVIAVIGWKLRGYNKRRPNIRSTFGPIDGDEVECPYVRRRPAPRERENDVPGIRRRRDGRARIQQEANRQRGEQEDGSGDDENAPEKAHQTSDEPSGKIGAKKLKKLQEKEERRKMREAAEIERMERRKEQEMKDELTKQEEERQKMEEEKQAEAEKKIQEEKERKEYEEYMKLKEMFSVEEEGQADVTSEEQSHNLLQEFVQYIKDTKVVLLEDLASHFGLRTQQAIDRIQEMLKDGILTGVIDDRGKFIYISTDELKAVAEFVQQRGRVSISELAQASNSLINLKPEASLTLAES